jgi:transaldolase
VTVTGVTERLAALTAAGTSAWLDEDALRGVASNPAIFEKAIPGSPDYDGELQTLRSHDLDAVRIGKENL